MSRKSRCKETTELLYLEDMYSLRDFSHTIVTVRIHRWFYYIPRVKLTMIEGYYKTEEEIEKALMIARSGNKTTIPVGYPKYFEIICRPEDMLRLAKTLIKICEPEEQTEEKVSDDDL